MKPDSAQLLSLAEEALDELQVAGHDVVFSAGPKKIVTIGVHFRS